MNMVSSFLLLRGFSVVSSSASDLLLPRVFDVGGGSSPGSATTRSSGRLVGLTSTLEGAWDRMVCDDWDNKFGVLL